MGAIAAQPPWYIGNNGATNFTRGEAQTFARSILTSETYRTYLKERAEKGTLAPAIECLLWHYAFGKPIEQVQLTVTQGQEDLSTLSIDELYTRATALAQQLEEARALADAIPADVLKGPW